MAKLRSANTPNGNARRESPDAASKAYDELAAHRSAVIRFLRLLGCDSVECEDLAQETLIRSWQSGGSRTSDGAYTWLIRIARNLFIDRRRRSKNSQTPSLEAWSKQAEQVAAEVWGRDGGDAWIEAARSCTAELPERTRAIVQMFYTERRSREQIAKALGMRESGVKTGLQRARAALRKCIEAKTK